MSPAGRRTDSSHEGNKYGGASPPDSIMLPLAYVVNLDTTGPTLGEATFAGEPPGVTQTEW